MKRKIPFIHKFIERLDKIDHGSIRTYVHDLAKSYEILLDIFKELDEAVILLDGDKKITYFNQAAERMLGLKMHRGTERYDLAILPDTNLRDALTSALKDPESLAFPDKLQLLEPRERLIKTKLLSFSSQNQTLFLCLASDISFSHGPAEWEQKISRIESLVMLASGVAHEIGNPLNSIGIHLQMLKKNIQASKSKNEVELLETVGIIQAETARLDKIVRHFLSATRKAPIRYKLENLNHIAREALDVMQPELKEQGIGLRFKSDSALPEFMLDRERIQIALVNLIKNSIEAIQGGGELHVGISHKANVAYIEVKDTGCGIENEHLPRIFDAYFTTKQEGHGLGLMTVFDAARDHGGKVDVSSRVGHGTTIKITLPIRQPKLQLTQFESKRA